MHVRVRPPAGEERVVPLISRLSRIEELRKAIKEKFNIQQDRQRLFYGGKLLENGYSLHDYNIKLNDVIQLIIRVEPTLTPDDTTTRKDVNDKESTIVYEDAVSRLYAVGDLIDMRDQEHGAWFEGTILRIVWDPQHANPSLSDGALGNNNGEADIESETDSSRVDQLTQENTEENVSEKTEHSNISDTLGTSNSQNITGNGLVTPKSGRKKQNDESSGTKKTPSSQRGITDFFMRTPKSSKTEQIDTNNKVKIEQAAETIEKQNDICEIIENGETKVNCEAKVNGEQKTYGKINPQGNHTQSSDDDLKVSDSEERVLFKITLVYDDIREDLSHYVKADTIRPRARTVIPLDELEVGQTVMINHNTDEPREKGFWYDFKVQEIIRHRKWPELIGTMYLGSQAIPQNDTKVRVIDKIFAIETNIPLEQRSEEYQKLMTTPTEQRALPLNCTTCRDNEELSCRDCGCHICAGKEDPEKIVLCDECNMGFHMKCLEPPMSELPEDDWYCLGCKRDPNTVVAPGAARQAKKQNGAKGGRDWGRGMACAGKTQTCAMPPNHIGPIPGVEVGMCWRFRIQLSESGIHRPPVSGIHGRDTDGAYSLVLSGGYEDDYDNGTEFTYTGSGGRDLSGNKRTAEQSADQQLTRENKALARSCAAPLSENGGDAGKKWREGRAIRVARSYKMLKHFPEFAPEEGCRYDGIYKVVKYYPETGKSGFRVWKYLLRRDDPSPPPWESHAPKYPIIYPEGYLEAEAEKKKGKEGKAKSKEVKAKGVKRVLRESNHSDDDSDKNDSQTDAGLTDSPPSKRTKVDEEPVKKKRGRPRKSSAQPNSPVVTFTRSSPKQSPSVPVTVSRKLQDLLTSDETTAIQADVLNSKLWQDCLEACSNKDKQGFLAEVQQIFLCIICQEVVAGPVTTKCQHNFCMSCLQLSFKSTGAHNCPYCRQNLSPDTLQHNDLLKTALRTLMPGYDNRKK